MVSVYLRKIKCKFIEELKDPEGNHLAQYSLRLVNNIAFCCEREPPTKMTLKKLYKPATNNEARTYESKNEGKTVDFAAVIILDLTRIEAILKLHKQINDNSIISFEEMHNKNNKCWARENKKNP